MNYKITATQNFFHDLNSLPKPVQPKAVRTLNKMFENPWTTELHPEKIHHSDPGVHSCRVDQKYRIIWRHVKPDHCIFFLVDNHDDAYRRAARMHITLEDGIVRVSEAVTTPPAGPKVMPFNRSRKKAYGKLFLGYRDRELLDFGVPEDILPRVRVLDDVNEIELLKRLLAPEVCDKLLAIALNIEPDPSPLEQPAVVQQTSLGLDSGPAVVSDREISKSLEKNRGGENLYTFVDSAEFRQVLEGKIEGWMLFLAPHQRSLVSRHYAGSARIRGVAGSGKTVVAIHRARQLAQQLGGQHTVLFLTYGNRLPAINHHLLTKLTGPAAPELAAIHCTTIHSWCYQLLARHGQKPHIDTQKTDEALQMALERERNTAPHLTNLWRKPKTFFADEIKYAIKGRALDSLEAYLKLARAGRGVRLIETERAAVWRVYERYQAQLQRAQLCDYDDYILQALKLLQSQNVPLPYRAAVVDEVQDLTEATLRLIRTIIPPGPNDLLLIGDGLQRLYPGGFVLSQLGIDVTGRSTVLYRNYRNTQEILRAAFSVVEHSRFNDLDDEEVVAGVPEYSPRRGPVPILQALASPQAEIEWVAQTIAELKRQEGYQNGDFVILYRWRKPYQSLIERTFANQIPVAELNKQATTYFGPALKHTTFDSAKGLEFKVVFLVGVSDSTFVPYQEALMEPSEREEHDSHERSRLFVAMSRARDRLYLSYAQGQPARFLKNVPAACLIRQ